MGENKSGGFRHKFLYVYGTTHLVLKDKVRFYYGLKGRQGDSGLIKSCRIQQLAKTVLLVPPKSVAETEDFLAFWKCKYQKYEVMIQ